MQTEKVVDFIVNWLKEYAENTKMNVTKYKDIIRIQI